MKKLLKILRTIIIAENGMSVIVGNAPISTKNKINDLQINNLEKLIRIKRNLNSQKTATKIGGVGTFAKTTNLNIVVDSKYNVYFGNNTGAYVLKIKYDKKIKFLSFYDKYKGEFELDTDNKKILFFGKNEKFHSWLQEREQSKIYNKIIIKTIDNQIVKEIVINVGNIQCEVLLINII